MTSITIQYNMALELINAVMRYARKDELCRFCNNEEGETLVLNPSVVEWIENIDKEISPFLRNDLMQIKRLTWIEHSLSNTVLANGLETGSQLISYLRTMPAEDFLKSYLDVFELGWDGEKALDTTMFLDALAVSVEEEDDRRFILDITKNPEELKNRVLISLDAFYNKFFKGTADGIATVLREKIASHTKAFKENPELFIRVFLVMNPADYTKAVEAGNIQIYISFYNELAIEFKRRLGIVIYGVGVEQRFIRELSENKRRQVFKALSDDKRVEILKLLAEREWYGNELAKHFNLTTATMSYHISKLVDHGMISISPGENNRFYYRLERDRVKELILQSMREIIGDEKKDI